jgi:hypothetical protein
MSLCLEQRDYTFHITEEIVIAIRLDADQLFAKA